MKIPVDLAAYFVSLRTLPQKSKRPRNISPEICALDFIVESLRLCVSGYNFLIITLALSEIIEAVQ